MALVSIDMLGSAGVNKDLPNWRLPPEAMTDARNMRFQENAVQRMLGDASYATPSADPWWLLPVPNALQHWWLYAGATDVYSMDSSGAHTNITRAVGGTYIAQLLSGWNGDVFNGLPVLNNGFDDPQSWIPAAGNKLVKLANWPANTKCKVMRSFKNYLVALDITDASGRDPYSVFWSHEAVPGTLPSSWNVADPTVDAGRLSLAESGGFLVDCLPLKSLNIVYKEDQTHYMQYVGGPAVFNFDKVLKFDGLFARNCAKAINLKGEKHVAWMRNDMIVHDGQTTQSLGSSRMRKWIFSRVDGTNYPLSHAVVNYEKNEVWFCFPEIGNSYCNLAACWNWMEDTWTMRDIPQVPYSTAGILPVISSSGTWDSDATAWDTDLSTWDERAYSPTAPKILMAKPGSAKSLTQAETTNQFTGANFTSYVERQDLSILGKDWRGNWMVDTSMRKLVTEVWPRVEAATGTQIDVYVGKRDNLNDSIVYSGPYPFVVGQDQKVNPLVEGRYISFKFQSAGNTFWKMTGYDFEVVATGRF